MSRLSLLAVLVVAIAVIVPPAAAAVQDGKARPAKPAATAAAPVNLNTATADQLETLPGIGPKAAQRIIEYRQKNGAFKRIEDIKDVSGIGDAIFEEIKGMISIK